MGSLRTVLSEMVGLFVDDGALALALVLCCAGVGLAMLVAPGLPAPLPAAGLLAGCVAILLVNVMRAGRRR